jgi:hypothetical protein
MLEVNNLINIIMKTIKNFTENELSKNELVNVKGGCESTVSVRNRDGSITFITFHDANGNGRLDQGDTVLYRITVGPYENKIE